MSLLSKKTQGKMLSFASLIEAIEADSKCVVAIGNTSGAALIDVDSRRTTRLNGLKSSDNPVKVAIPS